MAEQPERIIGELVGDRLPRNKFVGAVDNPAALAASLCTEIVGIAERAGAAIDMSFMTELVDAVTDGVDAAYGEGYAAAPQSQ